MPPARPRSEREWRALTPAYRQRIKGTTGYSKKAWMAGTPLPRANFGHGRTPSHGAAEAFRHPERYARYIAGHQAELNEYRRRQGERQLVRAPYGRLMPLDYTDNEPYTIVHQGDPLPAGEWRAGHHPPFDHLQQAQNYARESGAPPGIVQIWQTSDGRWQVYWADYEGRRKGRKAA